MDDTQTVIYVCSFILYFHVHVGGRREGWCREGKKRKDIQTIVYNSISNARERETVPQNKIMEKCIHTWR